MMYSIEPKNTNIKKRHFGGVSFYAKIYGGEQNGMARILCRHIRRHRNRRVYHVPVPNKPVTINFLRSFAFDVDY